MNPQSPSFILVTIEATPRRTGCPSEHFGRARCPLERRRCSRDAGKSHGRRDPVQHGPQHKSAARRRDDVALVPQSVTKLGDITAGGFIYLTRSKFVVPASATPGLHHITAKTDFGDEFLSNGPDFTVVAPAQ